MRLFQLDVVEWIAHNLPPEEQQLMRRLYRFMEEAAEFCQAGGLTIEDAEHILRHVYSRQVGDLFQEAGGVMVVFAAAATAADINIERAAMSEYQRINNPAVIKKIKDKAARMAAAHAIVDGESHG